MGPFLGEIMGVISVIHDHELFIDNSIWMQTIAETMRRYKSASVILNTRWVHVIPYGSITFRPEDLVRIHLVLPDSLFVATYIGAIRRMMTTREELLKYARSTQLDQYILDSLMVKQLHVHN